MYQKREEKPLSESDRRRSLPAVERLLERPAVVAAARGWSRRAVVAVVRAELERARGSLARGAEPPAEDELAAAVAAGLAALERPRPRRVVNAAGVVVHTNLGRSPLGDDALLAVAAAARGYSDLEFDLARGTRGSRHAHVDDLLQLVFPRRAALVVNNNAAALLLALNTLALGREVVVSRGELVEIGGSFRVPEILERSGARLCEVGTTNRTHLADYERAIVSATATILKVWPSNYRVVGFTAEVGVAELFALARRAGRPLVVDQGCGRLFKDGPGPRDEVSVEEILERGADLVCFSGDKLLGGPQCGVLVGAPDVVAACAKNPLARALRPGKLTIAALAATLRAWLRDDPAASLPAVFMLDRAEEDLRREAELLAARLARVAPQAFVELRPGVSRVGGGAAPETELPTWLVAFFAPGVAEEELLARLRRGDPPVVARAQDGVVLFDPRTLLPGEGDELADAVARALAPRG